jgi:peptide/nickel transport system permease protein
MSLQSRSDVVVQPTANSGVTRRRRNLLRALRKKPMAFVGLVIVLVFTIMAIIAPLIEPDSTVNPSGPVFAPPSVHHLLGTNNSGIDMLSLLIQGSRISLLVGFGAALIAGLLGGTIGLVSGFLGGPTDVVLMRLTDFFLVVPPIPLMIAIAAVWGPSLWHIILVIGLLLWTLTARVIRAQAKSLRERAFVKRAQSIGASRQRVILRHVLPQVAPLLFANIVLIVALSIFYETALDFLGLGDPTAVSWGTIIQQAFLQTAISNGAWWAVVPAGIAVALVVVGCYLFGQAMEEVLNPRLSASYLLVRPWKLRPLTGRVSDAL